MSDEMSVVQQVYCFINERYSVNDTLTVKEIEAGMPWLKLTNISAALSQFESENRLQIVDKERLINRYRLTDLFSTARKFSRRRSKEETRNRKSGYTRGFKFNKSTTVQEELDVLKEQLISMAVHIEHLQSKLTQEK